MTSTAPNQEEASDAQYSPIPRGSLWCPVQPLTKRKPLMPSTTPNQEEASDAQYSP